MSHADGNGHGDGIQLDSLDLHIVDLMLAGRRAKEIAAETERPLSTIQRRMRQLLESGAVRSRVELDYNKLGLKSGEIFVYLKNGDVRRIAEKLASMEGILSVSIHIGNSDIVCLFVYKDSAHLLDLTSRVRQIEGVDRLVWSEEIYKMPPRMTPSLTPVVTWARPK